MTRTSSSFLALTAAAALGVGLTTAVAGPTAARQNGLIAFDANVGKHAQLFTIRPDGTGQKQLTHYGDSDAIHPEWSPDGKKIAFERDFGNGAQTWVMNANGSGVVRLSPKSWRFSGDPVWTPDGKRILISHDLFKEGGGATLNLVDPRGGHLRRLFKLPSTRSEYYEKPQISPDGKRIAFGHIRGRGGAIATVGINGRGLRQLTPFGLSFANPHWSPDGRLIYFHSNYTNLHGKLANIYSIPSTGGAMTQITQAAGGVNLFGGVVSPDGTLMTIHKMGPGVDDQFVTNIDGTGERQLTHLNGSNPRAVAWGTNQG